MEPSFNSIQFQLKTLHPRLGNYERLDSFIIQKVFKINQVGQHHNTKEIIYKTAYTFLHIIHIKVMYMNERKQGIGINLQDWVYI